MNEEAITGSTQSAAQQGQMEPFDVSTNDWASYEERLTSFLIVNRVPEGDRVHAFLNIIGPSTYSLLKSLVAPELPSAKSFEVLKKPLGDHLSPKPSVIGEREKFHRRQQVEDESISDYVAELRKLARTCDFGSALDESLPDRFVCGLLREDIQRVLFTEDSKLTFQIAVERAVAMEAATKSTAGARTGLSAAKTMHKAPSVEQRRLQELLNFEGQCRRAPSSLLNKLRHLSGCPQDSNETPLRDNFLRRLPDGVRRILGVAVCDLGLDLLAQLADRVQELVAPQALSPVGDPLVDSELQRMRDQVSRLEQKVEELSLHRTETAPHQAPTPKTQPPKTPQTAPSPSDFVRVIESPPARQSSPPQKPQPQAHVAIGMHGL
ncbi:hypothetical protein V5799_012723 [Amblyomma americanum]|uniref:Retrotransposon gag domain-containing protein n=1 Tax=Amblyomma americanum TaxID=6943 RepID=A0AAQ4E857_AMBAM